MWSTERPALERRDPWPYDAAERMRFHAPLTAEGDCMASKRTTHRSVSGTKLYAVRDSKGRFKDIQTYKRAHGMDIKRGSRAEKKKR
jgi:hypothetical protein